MKKRILYIHGYGSNPEESSTLKNLRELLPQYEIEGVHYDQANLAQGQLQIWKKMVAFLPDALIGSSLGGFMALCFGCAAKKIVVNPCMVPSVELPLIGWSGVRNAACELEERLYATEFDMEDGITTLGFFGTQDNVLSKDYSDLFRKCYRAHNHCVRFNGHHSPPKEELLEIIPRIETFIETPTRDPYQEPDLFPDEDW